jgi:transposase
MGEPRPRSRHSDALVNRVRALKAAGHGYRSVARRLGLSAWTVRDWMRGRRRFASDAQTTLHRRPAKWRP